MPSMATSHGGILYYVVTVPKESAKVPTPVAASTPVQSPPVTLVTQASTESGWDNPFRPDGDLSREADEIVELIKVGKPITPTSGSPPPAPTADKEPQTGGPTPAANGGAPNGGTPAPLSPPRQAELLRSTAAPPAQAEHVTLKKKPKSKCCVVQ